MPVATLVFQPRRVCRDYANPSSADKKFPIVRHKDMSVTCAAPCRERPEVPKLTPKTLKSSLNPYAGGLVPVLLLGRRNQVRTPWQAGFTNLCMYVMNA